MYEVDVLIAGSGIAGVLIAARLSDAGFRCLLVDPLGIAAEQSGHSHGYLHQGYIYLRAEGELATRLKKARENWNTYIQEAPSIFRQNDLSLIGFENPNSASFAMRTWRNSDLPINPLARQHWPLNLKSTNLSVIFQTDEPSYDFTKILSHILTQRPGIEYGIGKVTKLFIKNSICRKVQMRINGTRRSVHGRHVVLASGIGNSAILQNTFGHFTQAPTIRTSFMLVIKGAELESLSLIIPENPYYGLFMVSRTIEDEHVWLISNYLSFSGLVETSSVAAKYWVRATIRTIDSLFPHLKSLPLKWGFYSAPKAELRRDPSRLPDTNMIENFGIKNVSLVWPTKLTLGPLLIDELFSIINKDLIHPLEKKSSSRPSWISPMFSKCHEKWLSVPLFDREVFLKSIEIS